MSDVKTLRLASAQLTSQGLDGFLTYQRVLLEGLGSNDPAQASWAGKFAFAHGRALTQSALDALTQQRLKVLVGEYCGKRSALITVQERVSQAEARVTAAIRGGQNVPPKEASLVDRARRELTRLGDFSAFIERYGPEAFALLEAHQHELLTLHRELSRLEGSGGHVHPASSH